MFFNVINLGMFKGRRKRDLTPRKLNQLKIFSISQRSIYLRNKMEEMVQKLNLPNIRLTKWSMAPIWGGSSLLFMQLRCMKDLLEFKKDKKWDWDYVLNLSEADFPIK